MMCQNCKQALATVHLTKVINNDKTEMHLCSACAAKQGEFEMFSGPQVFFSNLLSGLLQNQSPFVQIGSKEEQNVCKSCGCTYKSFSDTSFLGCDECYTSFGDRIKPIIGQIHGHVSHVGKVPKRAGKSFRVRQELDNMKRRLSEHIAAEEYEQAAILRDKIKRMEKSALAPEKDVSNAEEGEQNER